MDEHSRHHGTDSHFIIVWAIRVKRRAKCGRSHSASGSICSVLGENRKGAKAVISLFLHQIMSLSLRLSLRLCACLRILDKHETIRSLFLRCVFSVKVQNRMALPAVSVMFLQLFLWQQQWHFCSLQCHLGLQLQYVTIMQTGQRYKVTLRMIKWLLVTCLVHQITNVTK